MKVLLFDLYTGGHHLEFARELRDALAERDRTVDVDILVPAPAPQVAEFFDSDELIHLYDRSPLEGLGVGPDRDPWPTISRFLATSVLNRRWDVLADVADHICDGGYDVVHCLEVDKIVPYLLCQFGDVETPFVGSINGVFFKPEQAPLPVNGATERAFDAGTCPLVRWLPPVLREGTDWDWWFLGRCFETGRFARLTVPSDQASQAVRDRTGAARETAVVPDPIVAWDEPDGGKAGARARLDLPADATVLLSFGRFVEEKGIETLIAAIQRYDGPPLTVVFAGNPIAVTADRLRRLDDRTPVDVITALGFVPQDQVPTYFFAADGVLLPYRRSFGALRTSNVFNKACAANRPLIATDMGVLGQRVREHDLGLTVTPEDPGALAEAMAEFCRRGEAVYDPAAMETFAASQTFETLSERLLPIYREAVAQ